MVDGILQAYEALEVPKAPTSVFAQHLIHRRDAWFVRVVQDNVDLGLVYVTDIVVNWSGVLNVVFWDGRLTKERRTAVLDVAATALKEFELVRLSAFAPYSNQPLRAMLRKISFVHEGVIRQGWAAAEGKPKDLFMFGLLSEEVPWHKTTLISLA